MFKKIIEALRPLPKYSSVVEAKLAGDDEAVFIWHKAAQYGDVHQVLLNLAHFYRDGTGTKPNQKEYKKNLEKAAKLGSTEAMLEIAENLINENNQNKTEEALGWIKKASDYNSVEALRIMGDYYSAGKAITPNPELAVQYYERASKLGDLESTFSLGEMYRTGELVEKNLEKSATYFALMAEKKDSAGQYMLGICYEDGEGVEKSINKALELYTASADQGYDMAMETLGLMYLKEEGIAKNYIQAYKWISLASRTRELSVRLRNKIEQDMSAEELIAGNILVDNWLKNKIQNASH